MRRCRCLPRSLPFDWRLSLSRCYAARMSNPGPRPAFPPAHAAIEIRGLTKRYGRRGEIAALTDLSLTVAPGAMFGFLGPNGAGKTTAIRLLLGFIRPTAGSASIFG